MRIECAKLTLILFFISLTAYTQQLEESYSPILKGISLITGVQETTDGNFLATGTFDYLDDIPSGDLLKIDRTGKSAPNFNKVFTDLGIEKVRVLNNGKILIQGLFTRVNGIERMHLARLNSDGTLDNTFNPDNSIPIGDFELQSNGKIIITSKFLGGTTIIRLNPEGSKDTSFTTPSLFLNSIFHLEIDRDDNIYVADSERIQRLTKDGAIDNSFNAGAGPASYNDGQVYTIAAQDDGKLLIGGSFINYSGVTVRGLLRLNHNGSIDRTFGGIPTNTGVSTIEILTTGEILVGGNFDSILKYSQDGTTYESFAVTNQGSISVLKEARDEKILVGGDFNTIESQKQNSLALLDKKRTINSSFSPQISTAPTAFGKSLGLTTNGKVVLGGFDQSFNTIGNNEESFLRLNSDASFDNTFTHELSSPSKVISLEIMNDRSILLSGFLYFPTGLTYFARLLPNGNLDKTFKIGTGTDGIVERIRFNGTEIFLGGNFSQFNGVASQSFIILDHKGNIKQAYPDLPPLSIITDFDFQTNGKIIAIGEFSFSGNLTSMIRLNRDGTIDNSFTPKSFDNYYCIKVDAEDRIYAGGNFLGGKILKRFDKTGNLDATFSQGNFNSLTTNTSIRLIDILPTEQIVVGGSFNSYNGTEANGLIILDKDGPGFSLPSPPLSRSSSIVNLKYFGSTIFAGGKLSFEDGRKVIGLGKFKLKKDQLVIPATPAEFSSKIESEENIDFTWQDRTDAEDHYEIEKKQDDQFVMVGNSGANATAMIDSILSTSGETNYRIRASNARGASKYIYLMKLSEAPPTAPSNFEITQTNQGELRLSWTDNSSTEDGFAIERSIDNLLTYENVLSLSVNVQSAIDDEIKSGHLYHYRIASFNDAGYSEYLEASFEVVTEMEPTSNKYITIFPNPVATILHISSPENLKLIQILNQFGQILNTSNIASQKEVDIDFSNFPQGLYWLKTVTTSNVITKKVIKN